MSVGLERLGFGPWALNPKPEGSMGVVGFGLCPSSPLKEGGRKESRFTCGILWGFGFRGLGFRAFGFRV